MLLFVFVDGLKVVIFVERIILKGVIALGLLFADDLNVGGVQCAHFFYDGVVGKEGLFTE
jgi:hypothetical protein